MPAYLPPAGPDGRTTIIAVGKAAAAMAAHAIPRIKGRLNGLVVTRAGHAGAPHKLPDHVEVIVAGHPVPNAASLTAAKRALELASELGPQDRLLMLVSGGGSALMCLPAPGVALGDKQQVTRELLRSGATIAEINCVRKHLSRVKGGRLAVVAAPAHVSTFLISDIPGDDPSFIASGPTITDTTTLDQAKEIVQKYQIGVSKAVASALSSEANETPPGDALGLAGAEIEIIARAQDALSAASKLAEQHGYRVTNLGDHLQAEARHLGAGHAALAKRMADDGERRVILSGGETTVTVSNAEGRGGRNLEYLLSLALELGAAPGISAIACDTDGIDGTEDNAGAIITPDTLERAALLGLDPRSFLEANNAYAFFRQLGDLVITGPTRTNVNDFRAILIAREADAQNDQPGFRPKSGVHASASCKLQQ